MMQHPPSFPLPAPPRRPGWLERPAAAWQRLDAAVGRVFRAVGNPLHQSGTIAVVGFLVMVVSGLVLLIFYKLADPWGSTAAIERELPLGSWLRALHRYGADIAIVATLVHALRMLLAGRHWGPRSRGWWSGVLLLVAVLLCGWTGIILVWDQHGLWTARALTRMIDVLPILSAPVDRLFSTPVPPSRSFFFLLLFLHVALPLGLLALMLVHVSHLARPPLLPPRRLAILVALGLGVIAVRFEAPLGDPANPLILNPSFDADIWYVGPLWMLTRVSPWSAWLLAAAGFVFAVTLPRWLRPRVDLVPSAVDENHCTGCTTCYEDCPYDAISMVPRSIPSPLSEIVARVDPDRCVSCGICAASCAPMGIGPAGRAGRTQLAAIRGALQAAPPSAGEVVVFACRDGIGGAVAGAVPGCRMIEVACAGSVHSATIEAALRGGAAGVAVLACPHRDALYREGPKWLEARVFDGREADLKPRVDRRRIFVRALERFELATAIAELSRFREGLAAAAPMGPAVIDECRTPGEDADDRR